MPLVLADVDRNVALLDQTRVGESELGILLELLATCKTSVASVKGKKEYQRRKSVGKARWVDAVDDVEGSTMRRVRAQSWGEGRCCGREDEPVNFAAHRRASSRSFGGSALIRSSSSFFRAAACSASNLTDQAANEAFVTCVPCFLAAMAFERDRRGARRDSQCCYGEMSKEMERHTASSRSYRSSSSFAIRAFLSTTISARSSFSCDARVKTIAWSG